MHIHRCDALVGSVMNEHVAHNEPIELKPFICGLDLVLAANIQTCDFSSQCRQKRQAGAKSMKRRRRCLIGKAPDSPPFSEISLLARGRHKSDSAIGKKRAIFRPRFYDFVIPTEAGRHAKIQIDSASVCYVSDCCCFFSAFFRPLRILWSRTHIKLQAPSVQKRYNRNIILYIRRACEIPQNRDMSQFGISLSDVYKKWWKKEASEGRKQCNNKHTTNSLRFAQYNLNTFTNIMYILNFRLKHCFRRCLV